MLRNQMRYSRLANITKLINSKLDLREVLEHVTTAISEEIIQCNAVGIYLPQGDGTFRGFVGKPDAINGVTLDTQVIDPKTDLLVSEIVNTNRTIYIPDTSKDNRPDPRLVQAFRMKSLLALPISYDREIFGLIFLFDYGTPMNLTLSEIQSVEAYVNMAAVAMQNANYLKQREKLISDKQLLLDVTRELSMCSTVQKCLDKCFYYLEKVLKNQNIDVKLLDPEADSSIRKMNVTWGSGGNWVDTCEELKIDQCYAPIIQQVIQTKKAVLIPDVYADERLHHDVCRKYSVKGLFMIPFVSMSEVLGIIAAINFEEDGQIYKEPQIQLAQSIVDATASTLSSLLYMNQLENMFREQTKELEAAIEKKNNVIESISDSFFTLNKDWVYTFVNKPIYLQLKKTPGELLGKNMWELFPQLVDTALYKEFHKVMFDRIPVHFESSSYYSDCWYEIVAYPYGEGISVLIKDITENKKYEKELKRLSGLDLIGQMAAGISHEIRNPLTTVRGFLQLLNEENDYGKYKQYLKLMIEELDRANSIITEFLSMSSTKISELQQLDLNAIINDMTPLMMVDAFSQNKNVKLDLHDIPELELNRNEIRQLIINLYRNGLEAMSEGKDLTIRTYKEDGNVVLALKDQGDGIKPDVLEKLGTPFFTTKEKGTGLGLGVSYAIAARHNAKIEIETGKKGTTFFIKFH